MKFYFIFFIGFFLVLTGCQNNSTEIITCNDNNACTKDVLGENNICTYESIVPCCGNGVCESGEACNVASKTTSCLNDCGACEADIKISNNGCDGGCNLGADSFKVKGDSNLIFQIQNLGEDPVLINSEYVCNKQGLFGEAKLSYYGFSGSGRFENGQNSILVNGKDKTSYIIALTGKTQNNVNLECNLYFKSLSGLSSFNHKFFLKFE